MSATLHFPSALRQPRPGTELQAFGTRARVWEERERLRVQIDALHLDVERAFGHGAAPAGTGGVAAWPFGAERSHSAGSDATARLERVFAAHSQPVVAIEWQSERPDRVRLAWSGDDGLVVFLDGKAIAQTADIELQPGAAARLVIARADRPMPDVDALLGGSIARARRRSATRPSLTFDDAHEGSRFPIDVLEPLEDVMRAAVMAEARGRPTLAVRRAGRAPLPMSARERAFVAVALLAVNDPEPARAMLQASDPAAWRTGPDASGSGEPADMPEAIALVAGAWAAWTGEAEPLGGIWSALAPWWARVAAAGGAWAEAALALAPSAADLMGDAALAARLRERPSDPARALAQLTVTAQPGAEAPVEAAARTLRALHEQMGAFPDAPRGRLRLAPRLATPMIDLGHLAIGDATLSLNAESSDTRASITIEQTGGAAPLTIVLEPWMRARSLRAAFVDGAAAQLDSTQEGDGLRIRVQLVADQARRLDLEVERS